MEWPGRNHPHLNVAKTKELAIDFRRKRMPTQPLGEEVDMVDDFRYLGVHTDNKLD